MKGALVNLLVQQERAERRGKPRIHIPFPAIVRGVDATGQKFETNAVVENLSASGLYLRFWRCLPPGSRLFIATKLSTSPTAAAPGPRVAIRGQLLRAERRRGGEYGAAFHIERHRMF